MITINHLEEPDNLDLYIIAMRGAGFNVDKYSMIALYNLIQFVDEEPNLGIKEIAKINTLIDQLREKDQRLDNSTE